MTRSKRNASSKIGNITHTSGTAHRQSSIPPYINSDIPVRQRVAAILSKTTPFRPPTEPSAVLNVLVELAQYISILEAEFRSRSDCEITDEDPSPPTAASTSLVPQDQGEDEEAELVNNLNSLSINSDVSRFHGPNSVALFIRGAYALKQNAAHDQRRLLMCPKSLHLKFWVTPHWQVNPEEMFPALQFPPPELLLHLVDLYFSKSNTFFRILHRPTFLQQLSEGLHFKDYYFGCTVLVAIAIGSRHSQHTEVLLTADERDSAGWKYFRQIRMGRYVSISSVYELQLFALSALYQGASSLDDFWFFASQGLHLAQEVGAHKKSAPGTPYSTEKELWKSAFWSLVQMDVLGSFFSGRPRVTSRADYNLAYPTSCDDEYWDHIDPSKSFIQPPDQPSSNLCSVLLVKLLETLGDVVTALNPRQNGLPTSSHREVMMTLDSQLNLWFESIPDYLRWDPTKTLGPFAEQGAAMQIAYHLVRILAHKRYILKAIGDQDQHVSLAVCTNAAKSCIRIVGRSGGSLPLSMIAMFHSALVLLVNHWVKPAGPFADMDEATMAQLQQVLDFFRVRASRNKTAGEFHDTLDGLMRLGVSDTVESESTETQWTADMFATPNLLGPNPQWESYLDPATANGLSFSGMFDPSSVAYPQPQPFFSSFEQAFPEQRTFYWNYGNATG